jgi:hypothetical protein
MTDILIPPTYSTPLVDFRFSEHRLAMRGEAYPENALAFFTPITQGLAAYLARRGDAPILMSFQLRYMNSASIKMIFQIVKMLEQVSDAGRDVSVEFENDPDDEMAGDFAEDLADAFPTLALRLAPAG